MRYFIYVYIYVNATIASMCRTVEIRRRSGERRKRLRCMLFMLLINNYINFYLSCVKANKYINVSDIKHVQYIVYW